jgi:hypothetical protein
MDVVRKLNNTPVAETSKKNNETNPLDLFTKYRGAHAKAANAAEAKFGFPNVPIKGA